MTTTPRAPRSVPRDAVPDPDRAERDTRDRLRRIQAQMEAVERIGRADTLLGGDIEALAREITETACRTIGCERANVWTFNEAESELCCLDNYEATPGRHSSGTILRESEYSSEFQALKSARFVDADDPLTDPRTAGYVETYLKPLGITAMLDVAIRASGRNLGLICFEHVGRAHHWEPDEIGFGRQLADKFAFGLMSHLRLVAEGKVRELASTDALTGIANRRVFVEAVQDAIAQARRSGERFAVLYLDLDHFKDVNDTLGHPVGDGLLRHFADQLRDSVRATDVVARFGGDEFAVLARNVAEPVDAARLADKLLRVARRPCTVEGHTIHFGTSIGIAYFSPDAVDAETLLSHADLALYRAKADGRDVYRFFTEAMDSEVRERVQLASDLRAAIGGNALFLMYQPQVDLETGRIIGVEALTRWRHPQRGLVSPETFIAVAEENGLVSALGRWVLERACRQLRQWMNEGVRPPRLAVNLSALQFRAPVELEGDIDAAVAAAGIAPDLIEFELTESALMRTSRDNHDLLQRLRAKGYSIAIDDFGTGYSSLAYLARFPVDKVKIAQNFVANITREAGDAAVVRAAIGIGHALSKTVVAEGVENRAQLALLKSWGCTQVQGNLFAAPLLPEAASAFLRRERVATDAVAEAENAARPR